MAGPMELETEESLERVLESNPVRLFIVKFGAVWCEPCTKLQPHMDALAQELATNSSNAQVVLVDRTDDNDGRGYPGIERIGGFERG